MSPPIYETRGWKRRRIEAGESDDANVAAKPYMFVGPYVNALVLVLQRLPVENQIRLERVCRHWKEDVIPQSLRNVKSLEMSKFNRKWLNWRTDRRNPQKTGFHVFKSLLNRIGPQLTSLGFVGVGGRYAGRFALEELTLVRTKCPKLKKLEFGEGYVLVSQTVLQRLGTQLNQLECLSFYDEYPSDSTKANLSTAIASMTHLKELNVNFPGRFLCHLPTSVESVRLSCYHLTTENVAFLRNHSGLKQFQMKGSYNRDAWKRSVELLAQHCPQLTHLSFSCPGWTSSPLAPNSFADAFKSLKQLTTVEFCNIESFNDAALKSLCLHCPDLVNVSIIAEIRGEFGTVGLKHFGALRKLKRLKLNVPINNCSSVAVMLSGSGSTLEYLDLAHSPITDAQLLDVGNSCSSLAHIQMKNEGSRITQTGIVEFIDAVTRHASWDDKSKMRRLVIHVIDQNFHLQDTNLEKYGGRVQLKVIVRMRPAYIYESYSDEDSSSESDQSSESEEGM